MEPQSDVASALAAQVDHSTEYAERVIVAVGRIDKKVLELSPSDTIIKTYLKDIQHLEDQQITHEFGIKGPFQNLLDKAAKKRGWTLVPAQSLHEHISEAHKRNPRFKQAFAEFVNSNFACPA